MGMDFGWDDKNPRREEDLATIQQREKQAAQEERNQDLKNGAIGIFLSITAVGLTALAFYFGSNKADIEEHKKEEKAPTEKSEKTSYRQQIAQKTIHMNEALNLG